MASKVKNLLRAAQIAEARQDCSAAERCYRAAITADPRDGVPYASLGYLALRAARYAPVYEYALRGRQIDPNLVVRYGESAELAQAQGRISGALNAWQRALALQPGDARFLVEIAEALLHLGRSSSAEAAHDAASRAPKDARI